MVGFDLAYMSTAAVSATLSSHLLSWYVNDKLYPGRSVELEFTRSMAMSNPDAKRGPASQFSPVHGIKTPSLSSVVVFIAVSDCLTNRNSKKKKIAILVNSFSTRVSFEIGITALKVFDRILQ